ncbi:TRAP transporter large permease [Mesorhizobium sp. CAU 1732]|uniref:TRAP transporter large permease n=1 Tax=Mesorhizobium sp. CAU 1732 TaxID=3140358 RepID=UPI003261C76F
MTGFEIGLWSLGAILFLIYTGMHVAIALAIVSFFGIWILRDNPEQAARILSLAARESISSYLFGVVPLFVLMGLVVSRANIGRDTFDVATRFLGKLRGGLGISTVGANAIFASITGISIASAAVFTKIAVPEMMRAGHTARFSTGVVVGSSILGMLLPPSLLMILYGILAEQSVGALFIAGIGPGILVTIIFCVGIWLMVKYWSGFTGVAAVPETYDTTGFAAVREVTSKLSPIVILVGLVLGGLYGGIFTPTEAGAIGALGAIVIAFVKRRLTGKVLWQVTIETGHITAAICFLIIAATMYSRMLALTGLPSFLTEWIVSMDVGVYGFLMFYIAVLVLLGTILDSSSILLITVPLALPVAQSLGIDLIWFGMITILAVEIGLLTPPMGLSVFVVKGSLDDPSISLKDVFIGAAPFAVLMFIALMIIVMFPSISLGLL